MYGAGKRKESANTRGVLADPTPPHHVKSTPHQPALPYQPAPPHHVVSSPEPLELLVSEPEVSESKAPTRTSSRRTERIDYKALNDGKGTVFKKDI